MKLSLDGKQRFLRDYGFTLFYYTGKIKDAPNEIKHLLRDFTAGGHFVVNVTAKLLFPVIEPPFNMNETQAMAWYWSEAFAAVLHYTLAGSGWVLVHVQDGKVDAADTRKTKTWEYTSRDYERLDNGYYLVNSRKIVGPRLSYSLVLEEVAEDENLLEHYRDVLPPIESAVASQHPLVNKRFMSFVDSAVRWTGFVSAGSLRDGFLVQLYDETGSYAEQRFVEARDVREWSFFDTDEQLINAYQLKHSVN